MHIYLFHSKSILFGFLFCLLVTDGYSQCLSGGYTLNPAQPTSGANFQTMGDLATALAISGVCGPVTVTAAAGAQFNEQVSFSAIPGSSIQNTVHLIGNGATVSFAPVTGARHVVRFDGASFVTMEGFTILGTSPSFGYGIHFINNCQYDTIRNCTVDMSAITSTTAASSGGIVASASLTSNVTAGLTCSFCSIENNTVTGSGGTSGPIYGITLMGNTSFLGNFRSRVVNNIVRDFRAFGIYVVNGDSVLVEGNEVTRPTLTSISTTYYGLYTGGSLRNTIVRNNRVHTLQGGGVSTGTTYGLFNAANGQVGQKNLFANNALYNLNTNGALFGLYSSGMNHNDFVHNTIVLDDQAATTTGASYGMYFTGAGTGSQAVNNQVFITRSGTGSKFGIYQNTAGNLATCDYNNVYMNPADPAAFFGYITTNRLTQADFNAASNGVYQTVGNTNNPLFLNPSLQNFLPQSSLHAASGFPMQVLVPNDILNVNRLTNPTPGAFEAFPPQHDAGVDAIVSPAVNVCNSSPQVTALIRNHGQSVLNSVQVGIHLNGVLQGVQSFSALGLPTGADTLLNLGSVNTVGNGPYTFTVFTTQPNGQADGSALNDTSSISLVNGMQGVYTLDPLQPQSATNFITLQSFADALDSTGVCGPVDLFVSPGIVLNEQVMFRSFVNASAANRVYVHGQGARVEFTPVTATRYIVQLNGVSHLIIDSLNVRGLSPTFGFGYHLTNGCSYDTIRNCYVDMTALTSTTSTNSGGIIGSSTNNSNATVGDICDYCELSGNYIYGGTSGGTHSGIRLNGNTNGTGLTGTRISNNRIMDFYTNGIYINGGDSVTVEGNEIARPTKNSLTTFFGVYQAGNVGNIQIIKNRIHSNSNTNTTNTSAAYPIYFTASAPVGTRNLIANNLIYNINSNGLVYAINGITPARTSIVHNTIELDDLSATTTSIGAGLYITGATNVGNEIFNNNIVIRRGGTGNKYGIYLAGVNTVDSCDNNNVFMDSPTNDFFGFIGSNQAAQANFTAASGVKNFEANGQTLDPLFVNSAAGNHQLGNPLLDGTGRNLQSLVSEDILGVARPALPDPGAFEFTMLSQDISVMQWVAPVGVYCTGSNPIFLQVLNAGQSTVQDITFLLTVNGVPQSPITVGGLSIATGQDSIISLGNFNFLPNLAYQFHVGVQLVNGQPDGNPINDTASISLLNGMQGVYTLDPQQPQGGTNYTTLQSFANALDSTGVCGPVDLFVSPGIVLSEQVIFRSFVNASAANRVYVHGQGARVEFGPGSALRYIVQLNGVSHLIIDSLNVRGVSATYGFGYHLTNGCSYDTIRNCFIDMSTLTSTTTTNSGGIIGSSTNNSNATNGNICNYCELSGNHIDGGTSGGTYAGIRMNGEANGTGLTNTRIVNNRVIDFYFHGIYINGGDSVTIEGNEIARPNKNSLTTFYGIFQTGNVGNIQILKNRIHSNSSTNTTNASAAYPIYFNAAAPLGTRNLIANNLIYNINSNGVLYAINGITPARTSIVHNTIELDHLSATTNSAGMAIYITGSANVGNVIFNNNILVRRGGTGGKFGIYLGGINTVDSCDYNNVFMNSPTNDFFGHIGGANQLTQADFTLASWAGNFEANGQTLDPMFANPSTGNHQLGNPLLDGVGRNLQSLVPDDILGVARPVSPDPGAFEFSALAQDISLVQWVTPVGLYCTGNYAILLRVLNAGQTMVNDISFLLTVNGVPQPIITVSSLTLPSGQDTVVWLGNFSFLPNQLYNFHASVQLVNGQPDGNPANDTISISLINGMQGVYTLDPLQPPSATNFTTLQSFADALDSTGVCGPVDLFVSPGVVLNEQVMFRPYLNASAANRVYIHGQGARVEFSPVTTDYYIVQLNGVSHLIIDSLDVRGLSPTLGYGYHLTNSCSYDTIRNCFVDMSAITSTTATLSGGIIGSATNNSNSTIGEICDYCEISGNYINGGSSGGMHSGIRMNGQLNGVGLIGMRIANNRIFDFYLNGIYINGGDSVTIEGNEIARPTKNSLTAFYGVYQTGNVGNIQILKNRIHSNSNTNTANTSGAYPIFFNSAPPVGTRNLIANNLIYNINSNGIVHAINGVTPARTSIVHNTIELDNLSATTTSITAGIYLTTSTVGGNEIFNNNIVVRRGGTGAKYGIYLLGVNTVDSCDYNNVFMDSPTNNYFGYIGANQATQANFTAASGVKNFEANGQTLDPLFVNSAAGNHQLGNPLLDGTGRNLQGLVSDDILGVARPVLPDPGAFEVFLAPLDAGIASLNNPSGFACPGQQSVQVTVRNFGTLTLNNVVINWAVNGQVQTPFNASGLGLATGHDTVITIGTFPFQTNITYAFTLWTSTPNGGADMNTSNDSLSITLSPGMVGTYTVNGALPVTALNYLNTEDILADLTLRGVCGPVTVNIVNAIENVQLQVGPIPGTGPNSTVTFRSQAQDSTTVRFITNSTVAATNFVVRFAGASWVNFEYLSFQNSGRVLDFIGDNQHISIRNCMLISDTLNPGTTNVRTPVFSAANSAADNNISFENNRILGGAFGIFWYGATANNESNNRFSGNIFRKQNLRVAEFRQQQNLEFSQNDVLIEYNSTATTFGLFFQEAGHNLRINANYFIGIGAHPSQTIRFDNSPGLPPSPAIISNNVMISGDQTTGSSLFHIYLTNSAQVRVYNNSGTFNHGGNGSACLFADNTPDLHVVNNNFASANGNLAAYFYTNSLPVVSNHNNLYSGSGVSPIIFMNNSPVAGIGTWQALHGLDANSISVNPFFFTATDLRTCASPLDGAGTPLAQVQTDKDGTSRNPQTPDIGAYEFSAVPTVNLGPDIVKCSNASVVLGGTISGISNYQWSTNQTTPAITVQTPGLYTLTISGQCGTASDDVLVSDLPLPHALFAPIVIDPQFTVNNLSNGNGLTYNWNFGDGNTSNDAVPQHTYQQNGTYTVTLVITDSCGISDSSFAQVTIGNTMSLNNAKGPKVEVYPNPASEFVNLKWEKQPEGIWELSITDLTGRALHSVLLNDAYHKVALSDFPTGTYIFNVIQNDTRYVFRIIKH